MRFGWQKKQTKRLRSLVFADKYKTGMRNHDNPRLNHCDDLTRLNQRNGKCFDTLKEYTLTRVLGSGEYGLALLVTHSKTGNTLVIKMLPVDDEDSKTEIETACLIDRRIANENHIFARVYGWIQCLGSEMPVQWKKRIQKYDKKKLEFDPLVDECYFLVMEYGNGVPVRQYRFETMEDCKSFMFELIYTLMQAYTEHEYTHNDLHPGNVMYIPGPFTERTYRNVTIEATGRPMIIDYGLSTFGSLLHTAREYERSQLSARKKRTDEQVIAIYLEFLMPKATYPFPNRHGKLRDIYKMLYSLIESDNQDFETDMWLRQLYDTAKVSSSFEAVLNEIYPIILTFTNAPVDRCHVCGNVATHQYQHARSYKFCERAKCIDSMVLIGSILNE